MSTLMSASSLPNRNFARDFASFVLPTPVGPRKMNEPTGRFGDETPARLRLMALLTAFTASSWPITSEPMIFSISRRCLPSPSSSLSVAIPVVELTILHISSTVTCFLEERTDSFHSLLRRSIFLLTSDILSLTRAALS